MIGRAWSRYGWQLPLALVLSMLSLLSVTELHALEWLGWFGIVGSAVAILITRLGRIDMTLPGSAIGFAVNVAALFGVFLLLSRLLRRRSTAENHGADWPQIP